MTHTFAATPARSRTLPRASRAPHLKNPLTSTYSEKVQITKAMHLYEAGVPLPYIRDILGHVDLTTTEIYARASTEAKRKALEATYTEIVTDELPEWNNDSGLLTWLASL